MGNSELNGEINACSMDSFSFGTIDFGWLRRVGLSRIILGHGSRAHRDLDHGGPEGREAAPAARTVARGLSAVLLAAVVALSLGCGGSGANGGGDSSPESSAPEAPSGLSGTSGDGQVSLDWQAAGGAEAYNVYRATSSSSVMDESPLEGSVSSTTYTDGSAKNGTRYYYVVTSVGSEGAESGPSDVVSRAPFSSPPDRP